MCSLSPWKRNTGLALVSPTEFSLILNMTRQDTLTLWSQLRGDLGILHLLMELGQQFILRIDHVGFISETMIS